MTAIAIVDYGIGNIKSLHNALQQFTDDVFMADNVDKLIKADGVVLPGVGAFGHAMSKLKSYRMDRALVDYADTQKPLLGICLGMQLLFSSSHEFGHTNGLNLIAGEVKKLNTHSSEKVKLPHIAWNELEYDDANNHNPLLSGIEGNNSMYFVHSYHAVPENKGAVSTTTNYADINFCSTVRHNNIYGCQYHPEKSGINGLKIINNFVNSCQEKYHA